MKKLVFIFCFFVLLLPGFFYGRRLLTKNSGGEHQAIKESINYFFKKIGYFASVPYRDAEVMFQWGYKKLKGQPASQSELIQARKAFFRTGIPIGLILAIIGRVLYKRIKMPKPLLKEDKEDVAVPRDISPGKLEVEAPLADVPVPDACLLKE